MTNRRASSPATLGFRALVVLAALAGAQGCDDSKARTAGAADAVTVGAADAQTSAQPPAVPTTASPVPATDRPAAVPEAITAQHVLVAYKGAERTPKGVSRSKAEAKKRADEVAAKARSGSDFSALVAEYSDDPAANERRGSLGKFTRDKMAKPFSDAAFALAVGESSGPVETPFGFHVIKRNQ